MTITARPSRWRRLAKLAVSAAFAVACLWWLALLAGPEHFWLSGAFLYLPYWLYLPPVLLVGVLSWPLGWRWRLIALATLAVVLWPIMGFSLGAADTGSGGLRVMTYNIKSYLAIGEVGGFDDIIAEVRKHDPDIIVMQDAASIDLNEPRDLKTIREAVGTRSLFAFGQFLIASRVPLSGCKVGDVSYDEVPHTFVQCVIRAHGQDIDLYTAHFVSPRDGLNAFRWEGLNGYAEWRANAAARILQAEKLARIIEKRKRPAIVAGDLNAPEPSLVIQTLLETGLRDAFSSAGIGYGFTHGHSLKPHLTSTIRIDHILVSREIGVEDCFVGGSAGSEHRPVIADLWVY